MRTCCCPSEQLPNSSRSNVSPTELTFLTVPPLFVTPHQDFTKICVGISVLFVLTTFSHVISWVGPTRPDILSTDLPIIANEFLLMTNHRPGNSKSIIPKYNMNFFCSKLFLDHTIFFTLTMLKGGSDPKVQKIPHLIFF